MTVKDLEANWDVASAAVRTWGIDVLANGWIDGKGWGGVNSYAYGPRAGWIGGKMIMRPSASATTLV